MMNALFYLRTIRDEVQELDKKVEDLIYNGAAKSPEKFRIQLHASSVQAKNISDNLLEIWRKQ